MVFVYFLSILYTIFEQYAAESYTAAILNVRKYLLEILDKD